MWQLGHDCLHLVLSWFSSLLAGLWVHRHSISCISHGRWVSDEEHVEYIPNTPDMSRPCNVYIEQRFLFDGHLKGCKKHAVCTSILHRLWWQIMEQEHGCCRGQLHVLYCTNHNQCLNHCRILSTCFGSTMFWCSHPYMAMVMFQLLQAGIVNRNLTWRHSWQAEKSECTPVYPWSSHSSPFGQQLYLLLWA